MADDVNDKTIALAITTERVTTHVLYDALKQLLISQRRNKKQHNKPKMLSKGKHTLKEMKKENTELTSIKITEGNIKSFEKYARKYHVAYSLKKDKSADKPKYYVFFRAKDVDSMQAAFKEFCASVKKAKDKPTLKEEIKNKSKVVENVKQVAKVKNMKQEMAR